MINRSRENPQMNRADNTAIEVSVPDYKKGWMSANAIAKVLEGGLGDKIFWDRSLTEGVPDKKNKILAIVSVHAIRFLAQKYLRSNPELSEIQRNKTQVKEQYAPELVQAIIKDIKGLKNADGYIPEYRVAKMLGLTQAQLQEEMRYWVYNDGQIKVAKEFNRIFICIDPHLLENLAKK
jgi:hypothetical protein